MESRFISKKEVLGWNGSYYSVWNISEFIDEIFDAAGNLFRYRHHIYYNYGRKVSKYLDKAIAKYPGIEVNEKLENVLRKHFEECDNWEYVSNDVFRVGKYKGQKISECQDFDYMEWYRDNTEQDTDHKDLINKYLIENGNYVKEVTKKKIGIFKVNNIVYKSPKTLIKEDEDKKRIEEMINILNSNSEVVFHPTRNLNNEGNYVEENIVYHFNQYKFYTYMDYEYCLPLINKVGKKIKNKTVKINSYTYSVENNILKIFIKDFSIL